MAEDGAGHAIIGCGRVAPNHVDGFRALGTWQLRWACDRDPDVAKAFAAEYDIPQSTTSVGDVFGDPAVVSVSIATDHAQHVPLAEAALRAGKHVLVEKPLALSTADAERLAAFADERELVLSVVSQHCYDPLVLAVRQWLADGLLGRLLYAQVSLEARREPEYYRDSYWRGSWAGEGGSALVNQGYHCLDVTRFLCGELDVKAVLARHDELGAVLETEDTLSALLVAGRIPVTFNVTVASTTTWRTRLELIGSAGSVCLDLDHPGTLHRASGNAELERRAATDAATAVQEPTPGVNYYGISHRRQIADFAGAIRDGRPLAVTARHAVGMVALLERIYGTARQPGSMLDDAPTRGAQ